MAERLQKQTGGNPHGFAMVMSADVAQQGIDDGSWGPSAMVTVDAPGPLSDKPVKTRSWTIDPSTWVSRLFDKGDDDPGEGDGED